MMPYCRSIDGNVLSLTVVCAYDVVFSTSKFFSIRG